MESVRSAFHAQLATVMDSLLAAAVCEIAKIFEGSLCEQQAELVQKGQEISLLRGRLEKAERRLKGKGGGEEGDAVTGDGEGEACSRQKAATGSVGNDLSPPQDSQAQTGLNQSLRRLKEETTGLDGAPVKHERTVPRLGTGSAEAQAQIRGLVVGDQRQGQPLSDTSQSKAKLSHWEAASRSVDHRPLQEQASAPFLSISQTGRCSPRPDPSLAQQGEWLPGLDTNRGGVSGLDNLQQEGTSCSATGSAASTGTGTGNDTSCFRPGFGSDETSNEDDDSSFPFLDQDPENQNSNQNPVPVPEQRETRQDQAQGQSGPSPWRQREDRARGPLHQNRRTSTFTARDPLRPHSNTLPNTHRHTHGLSHAASPAGGNGRPYTCPYCSKCFTYPSHQRRHLLRHTGVRLHPCQFCDKSFLTPSELTVHTRTHTGERPFGCAQCGKRFARSGNLRAHQRDVHMGKRPFGCNECGKRFAHRGNLRVHNHRVHQGDPYYMDDQQEADMGQNPI